MKQAEIKQKQNESFFLKCQFAAKFYFNRAETLNYFVWLFCIFSALTVFIPSTNNWIIIGIPLLFDAIGFFLEHSFENSVTIAAKLRNYFDANVLDINKLQYTDSEIMTIKDIVEKTVDKHTKKYTLQINHTGHDSPPGVLDWYEFSHNFSDDDVQFECQRQNCWWNQKLSQRRILVFIIGLLLLLSLLITVCQIFDLSNDIFRVILCSSIVIKVIERIIHHYECHKIFLKIEGACVLVENNKTKENIYSLQTLIEKRREIPILEINGIHQKIASKLSKEYQRIS